MWAPQHYNTAFKSLLSTIAYSQHTLSTAKTSTASSLWILSANCHVSYVHVILWQNKTLQQHTLIRVWTKIVTHNSAVETEANLKIWPEGLWCGDDDRSAQQMLVIRLKTHRITAFSAAISCSTAALKTPPKLAAKTSHYVCLSCCNYTMSRCGADRQIHFQAV